MSPGRDGANHYLRAIRHSDPAERTESMIAFLSEEMYRTGERLAALENDDGSIPDGNAENWSYEKGKLDTLRTVYGLVGQRRAMQNTRGGADE